MMILYWDSLLTDDGQAALSTLVHSKNGTALTIGGFDGPHLGHEALFSAVQEAARDEKLVSGIVTFIRSPGHAKRPDQYPGDVSTLGLRIDGFAKKGFEFALLIDFSGNFGKMTGGVFFDILVKTVRMRYLAVGPDFRCGHRLDTGVSEISDIAKRVGFRFDSIMQVDFDGERVSSSAVRDAIQSADFSRAERLLGHPFLLDFTIPDWNCLNKRIEAKKSSFTQILPRRGRYNVVIHRKGTISVNGLLEISDSTVVLIPDPEFDFSDLGSITTIQFRLS